MKDFQFFRSYMFQSDTLPTSQDIINQLDMTLTKLSKDLDSLKSQYQASNNVIHNELTDKLTQYQSQLHARSESTLNLVGKNDQVYLVEIDQLKKELSSLVAEKQRLEQQLTSKKTNEEKMSYKLKEMQGKIEVFENVDENKGPWFDSNFDVSGAMDIDRITKALKKSVDLIAILQAKLDSQSS